MIDVSDPNRPAPDKLRNVIYQRVTTIAARRGVGYFPADGVGQRDSRMRRRDLLAGLLARQGQALFGQLNQIEFTD